jgi:hypothetical protein
MVFGTKQGAAMKRRVLQIVGVVAVVAAGLSAPVALLAIGNSFRIAARMADASPNSSMTVVQIAAANAGGVGR